MVGTDSAPNGCCTPWTQEEVGWETQDSSCILGLEGCLRLGPSKIQTQIHATPNPWLLNETISLLACHRRRL